MIRYGLAVVSVAIATAIALGLERYGIATPFAIMLLAVTFSVWQFGVEAGLLSALTAIACLDYIFLGARNSFILSNSTDAARLFIYSLGILFVWLLGSAQHRAQRTLKRNEAYLAYAQTLSRTGSVSFVGPEGEMFWSAEAYRILGYEKTVLPTLERLLDRVHPADLATSKSLFYCATQPAEQIEFEHRLLMPDSSIKWVRILGNIEPETPSKVRISGAVMDVTAEKATRSALFKAEADLAHVTRLTVMGELLASISHEIKQPLAAIQTNAETGLRWLKRDVPNLDEARGCLTRIVNAATRAADLTNKIRGMTRKTDVEMVPLDLNRLVEEVVPLLEREARERSVNVTLELTPDLPAILGDWTQLQQVVVNLMMNGFDAMGAVAEDARHLLIRSYRDTDRDVSLEVQDAGIGIGPDLKARLFETFFTTKSSGMGMGLSICRSIVEAHGGRIEAFNNVERGATFRFTLPADCKVEADVQP